MHDQEEIDRQLERLRAHRRTLAHYLTQQARLGSAGLTPDITNGIYEARENIGRIKQRLLEWGAPYDEHPDDGPAAPPPTSVRPRVDVPQMLPKVDVSQLPIPTVNKLFDREQAIAELTGYLNDPNATVVSVVAFAGFGKSTLIDAFLSAIAPIYNGAAKVFGWHFFSQESQDATVASSSLFFERALRFFDFDGSLPVHDNEKAKELVKLLQSQKAILVLDGIEPLQHSPQINQGYFSDRAMQIFLTEIARDGLPNGGLVMVTSRQPLTELERFSRYRQIDLKQLSVEAGVALLRYLGVKGQPQELREAVIEYKGHALSLVLLAKLLVSDYEGDVLERASLNILDTETEGKQTQSILDYYDHVWRDDEPEKIFLFLLSLFNRPMQREEFEVLLAQTDFALPLRALPRNKLNRIITHLKNSGLVLNEDTVYDTHSLIRSYFAQKFRHNRYQDFVDSHTALFRYFQSLPSAELPADLDGLEPLYRAIYHGCMAREYQAALDIYWKRISRERAFYSQKTLGAISSDLFAICQFFPNGWDSPVKEGLSEERQAWLLAVAAFLLTSLGRFDEAIRPRHTEIRVFQALGDWGLAAGDSRNLAGILLPVGKLDEALDAATRAVEFAGRMADDGAASQFSKSMNKRVILTSCISKKASVFHYLGKIAESLREFEAAEQLYGQPLDRSNGYHYCDLLLDLAQSEDDLRAVLERGQRSLEQSERQDNLENIGNDNLTIANAYFKLKDYDRAGGFYEVALDRLQKSGRVDRLPPALLAKAEFHRAVWSRTRDEGALKLRDYTIQEAEQIISLSRMRLYDADLMLVKARIALDDQDPRQAQALCEAAARQIQRMKYGRKLNDLEQLRQRLQTMPS